MLKTIDLLEKIIDQHNLKDRFGNRGTAYSLQKYMHDRYGSWSMASVSFYFSGKAFPDRPQCVHIAAELGFDPAHVIAIVDADREKNPQIKAILEEAALQLGPDNREHRNRKYNHELRMYQHADEYKKYYATKAGRARKTAAGAILTLALLFGITLQTPEFQAFQTQIEILQHNAPVIHYTKLAGILLALFIMLPLAQLLSSRRFFHSQHKGLTYGSVHTSAPGPNDPGASRRVLRPVAAHLETVREKHAGLGAQIIQLPRRIPSGLARVPHRRPADLDTDRRLRSPESD